VDPADPPPTGGREPVPSYAYLLIAVVVALAFQGSRGIFEPDEGRHVFGALQMIASGDWLVPRLHELIYLDKPPAVYWAVALGFKLLGLNEWGARLVHGLSLIATALLVGAWVRPALGKAGAQIAAAAYATALLPVIAANSVTPDALLSVSTTAAFLTYWRYRDSTDLKGRYLWALGLGLSLASGLFVKGTAALIFAAPIVLHLAWELGPIRPLRRLDLWLVLAVALGLGAAWYLYLGRLVPGSLDYFYDNQIAGRLWGTSYARNSEWWKPFKIYYPVVILGALPWSALWLRVGWRLGARRLRQLACADSLSRFMLLSIAVPLLVLSIAKSRLELYTLPILAPAIGLTVLVAWRSGLSFRWRRALALAAVAMIAIKGIAAHVPTTRDSRYLAQRLTTLGVEPDDCVEILNQRVHGLRLYGYEHVARHMTHPETYPLFEAPDLLNNELDRLAARCHSRIFIVSLPHHLDHVIQDLGAREWTCGDPQDLDGNLELMPCRSEPSAAGNNSRETPSGS